MKLLLSPLSVLIGGFILLLIVFSFIIRQDNILRRDDKSIVFTAYNTRIKPPAELISIWKNNAAYSKAIKTIIYLDYILMLVYGTILFYGLRSVYTKASANWKITCFIGMILIVSGVLLDAIQDNAIYQHLTRNKFTDFRGLTRLKFGFIFLSVLILIASFISNRKMIS
ncbi:hypothetical protein [Rubrolithibacter danxiaensis]|uniref:hypothetical protein n=1 Tax=Rubrolithibacter danxiaensis TaxID=3390805 RepID=UPI003BF7FB74